MSSEEFWSVNTDDLLDLFFLGYLDEQFMREILGFFSRKSNRWQIFLQGARVRYEAGRMAEAFVHEYERTNKFLSSDVINFPVHNLPPTGFLRSLARA